MSLLASFFLISWLMREIIYFEGGWPTKVYQWWLLTPVKINWPGEKESEKGSGNMVKIKVNDSRIMSYFYLSGACERKYD